MKFSNQTTIMALTLLTTLSASANPRLGVTNNRGGTPETRVQENSRRGNQVAPGVAAGETAQGVIGNAARMRNDAARARQDALRTEREGRQQAVGNIGANAAIETPAQQQQANAGGARGALSPREIELQNSDKELFDKLTTLANGTSSAANGAREALRTALEQQNPNFNHLSAEKRQQIKDCIN